MAHPFNSIRGDKVSKARVGEVVRGRATGGRIPSSHGDASEDLKMIKATVKPGALKMDAAGKACGGRLDKAPRKSKKAGGGGAWGVTKFDNGYLTGEKHGDTVYVDYSKNNSLNSPFSNRLKASETKSPDLKFIVGKASGGKITKRADGGAVNGSGAKKGTNVNIIIAPQGGAAAGTPPPPMPPLPVAGGIGSPSPVPPAPPMGGPPEMPPMQRDGGRVRYASGGKVGGAWKEGIKNGTKVQHTDGKNDGKDIYRPKQVTYAKGGAVDKQAPMGPRMRGGAEGGLARLQKMRMQKGK